MELEEVKEKLTKPQYDFFLQLKEQIDLPLYFLGSITRSDYIKDKSDLDIEIFTDNINTPKIKIEYLFDYYQRKDKNSFIVFEINNVKISGYKYYFQDKQRGIRFDFTIYNLASKNTVLYHRNIEKNIPYLFSIFLFMIKFLYYHLHIISNTTYSNFKKIFWKLYNPEKSVSKTLNEMEYINFYNNQGNKEYLVKVNNHY
jgi:hypothetical protein